MDKTATVPLPQANRQLSSAVAALRHRAVEAVTPREMVLFWIRSLLLGAVQKYAAARFQKHLRPDGNVDLIGLQAELVNCVDRLLIGSMKRRLRLGTLLVMVGYPLQVLIMLVLALIFAGQASGEGVRRSTIGPPIQKGPLSPIEAHLPSADVYERDVAAASFDVADIRAVNPRPFRKVFLGHPKLFPPRFDREAKPLANVGRIFLFPHCGHVSRV